MSIENSMGEYLLSQCRAYTSYPPNNPFALGRMSYILELANMIGYGKAEAFIQAQDVFKDIAPKITAAKRKRKINYVV